METEHKSVIKCPRCESEYVLRAHRGTLVKLFISKKYFVCSDCGKHFYVEQTRVRLNLTLVQ